MIGAMPAVAVRHERRKNKTKDKFIRPNRLLLKPQLVGGSSATPGEGAAAAGSGAASPLGSHAVVSSPQSCCGTPTHVISVYNCGTAAAAGEGGADRSLAASVAAVRLRYGDECFYNKVSLLHFIIFFMLGGLTVLIVGAVQFKREAGLSNLRYHFLVVGATLVGIGFLLLAVKCVYFRTPLPDEDDEFDDFDEAAAAAKPGGSNHGPVLQRHHQVRQQQHHQQPQKGSDGTLGDHEDAVEAEDDDDDQGHRHHRNRQNGHRRGNGPDEAPPAAAVELHRIGNSHHHQLHQDQHDGQDVVGLCHLLTGSGADHLTNASAGVNVAAEIASPSAPSRRRDDGEAAGQGGVGGDDGGGDHGASPRGHGDDRQRAQLAKNRDNKGRC